MDKKQKKSGVFMMRAEGQTLNEFKKACVKAFRDAGMLKESKSPPEREPDPGQLKMHEKAEKDLPNLIKRTGQPRSMDTWWIDKPHLLGSRNPTDTDLEQLRGDGFGVLISLLCEEEQTPRYGITRATALGYVRYNIGVQDFCPPTVEQLEQFVKLIDGLSPGTKIIIHCEGGTGRTGTFAVAYWVTKGMTVADAKRFVRKARRHAVEMPKQEEVLVEFARRIRA